MEQSVLLFFSLLAYGGEKWQGEAMYTVADEDGDSEATVYSAFSALMASMRSCFAHGRVKGWSFGYRRTKLKGAALSQLNAWEEIHNPDSPARWHWEKKTSSQGGASANGQG